MENSEEMRPLGRLGRMLENNIKMEHGNIGLGGVGRIKLAQYLVEGSCENCIETLGSIRYWKIFVQLSD